MARLAGAIRKMSPGTAEKSALRVLVADDEPLIRWSVCEVLGESGDTVCEAGDDASVVELLSGATRLFDVIVPPLS